eukprot:4932725-Amphidinium_carterae.2
MVGLSKMRICLLLSRGEQHKQGTCAAAGAKVRTAEPCTSQATEQPFLNSHTSPCLAILEDHTAAHRMQALRVFHSLLRHLENSPFAAPLAEMEVPVSAAQSASHSTVLLWIAAGAKAA